MKLTVEKKQLQINCRVTIRQQTDGKLWFPVCIIDKDRYAVAIAVTADLKLLNKLKKYIATEGKSLNHLREIDTYAIHWKHAIYPKIIIIGEYTIIDAYSQTNLPLYDVSIRQEPRL